MVLVSGLSQLVTDSEIKRECVEYAARPKFIYMHVSDLTTGLFSGTCVIEFSEVDAAVKAVARKVMSCSTRPVTQQEFQSLTSGEWPMVEYGPAQGVFAAQLVSVAPQPSPVPAPTWASRPPPSNPWQK